MISNYYSENGYPLLSKSVILSGGGTHSIWIPRPGSRVVVTNIGVTSVDVAGTIAFYFDNGNDKIAMYAINASSSIFPGITGWESTVVSGRIFAVKTAIQTDGIQINLNGFEIPVAAI